MRTGSKVRLKGVQPGQGRSYKPCRRLPQGNPRGQRRALYKPPMHREQDLAAPAVGTKRGTQEPRGLTKAAVTRVSLVGSGGCGAPPPPEARPETRVWPVAGRAGRSRQLLCTTRHSPPRKSGLGGFKVQKVKQAVFFPPDNHSQRQ